MGFQFRFKEKEVSTKKSIRRRLLMNFIMVIVISVGILDALLIYFVKQHFYNNVEAVLTNQIKISADFYSRYFSNTPLEYNVLDNVDVFWKQTTAQVQIITLDGKVLLDSIGVLNKKNLDSSDFKKAVKGETGASIGKVDYDDAAVLAVSYPLKADDKTVGVLRFITSLREVDREVGKIAIIFISVGVVVVFAVVAVSLFMADSIVNPIKEVTRAAQKMASGNFTVRSKKYMEDEIGKLSDTLNYMADEIVKREQLKNEFIASVSHELRTPLTAIKGWAVTLNDQQIEDMGLVRDGLQIIEKETERLASMVEEMLDFSKFVSGKVVLNKEKIDLNSFLEYIKKYIDLRSDRDKIQFVLECPADLPEIQADRNRLKQVLINVLDNAFKFTAEGGKVVLTVNRDKKHIYIAVKDTGCGISREELPKVKERFYKGKNSKSQNGLGLSISDEIVKLHGGSLEFESELNVGTTVYITLPI